MIKFSAIIVSKAMDHYTLLLQTGNGSNRMEAVYCLFSVFICWQKMSGWGMNKTADILWILI